VKSFQFFSPENWLIFSEEVECCDLIFHLNIIFAFWRNSPPQKNAAVEHPKKRFSQIWL
jgi:hypothetical protein